MNKNINQFDNDSKAGTFWKKQVKAIPGRPSPCKNMSRVAQCNPPAVTTFQRFQESVNDAWHIADDDYFNNILTKKTGREELKSCALKVSDKLICDLPCPTTHIEISCEQNVIVPLSPKENKPVMKTKTSQITKNKVQPATFNYGIKPKFFKQISSKPMSGFESFESKVAKFLAVLNTQHLNLENLRKLSWSGVPDELRPIVWRLLAGYLPMSLERRQEALERKRLDYWNLVGQYYDSRKKDDIYQETYRQIHIDIPRMSPMISLFKLEAVQEIFERILFIWAIRHPASGYVQGINDLVTPFFVVFLMEEFKCGNDLDNLKVSSLPKDKLGWIEADTFWCFSRFLDSIQDNYIFAQLGIQQKVNQLADLVQRIDGTLHEHLQKNGVSYLQFSFRWMNNMLTRELPLLCTIRLWDTYLAEADFSSLHKYVCSAFLLHWRKQLLTENDFQGLMLMLQNFPTKNWTDKHIEILVAEAYKLKYSFDDAPNHLHNNVKLM